MNKFKIKQGQTWYTYHIDNGGNLFIYKRFITKVTDTTIYFRSGEYPYIQNINGFLKQCFRNKRKCINNIKKEIPFISKIVYKL